MINCTMSLTPIGKSIKQRSRILATGGAVFDLQHGGGLTCAVVFRSEIVVIGGSGDDLNPHGKVDR